MSAIPFVLELRVVVSWLWTKTSLDLFQWLKFEDIYQKLYLSKCEYHHKIKGFTDKAVGVLEKFLWGGCSLIFMLAVLIGPIIIFSGLNPISELNPIEKGEAIFGIDVNDGYLQYELFRSSHVKEKIYLTDKDFHKYNLSYVDMANSVILNQIEKITFDPRPDRLMITTNEVFHTILSLLNDKNNRVKLFLYVSFTRTVSQ